MLNDIYPFGMVGSLLRHPIGVFLFMITTYKTKTTVQGRFVDIQIFKNGKLWFSYDFAIERLDEMVNDHLIGKRWATPENLIEIRDSVLQHLNRN
jgi:hypothetical protein